MFGFLSSLIYKHLLPCRMFTRDEIDQIMNITLWDIIVNASSVTPDEIQRNVFFHLDGEVCPQIGQLNGSTMEPCPYLSGFDYFRVRWLNLCT